MTAPAAGDLRGTLRALIHGAAVTAGFGEAVPPVERIVIELTREFAHGDLACPIAFGLAKAAKRPPAAIAQAIAAAWVPGGPFEKVEVAGGGYLNFFLGDAVWREVLAGVAAGGAAWGTGTSLAGERFLVEFVSANPTGPLLVVNARAAAYGDALCRVLVAQGAAVEREYLVNDAGAQVRNLALSVEARWLETNGHAFAIPADGYHGDYVKELAGDLARSFPDLLPASPDEGRLAALQREAVNLMVLRQREDLGLLAVGFDRFFAEKAELHATGKVAAALEALQGTGEVFEQDGARWFRATKFGDDKDRVMVKKDGAPTYTLPDIAYHRDKFARGYSRVVDIVGTDHQVEMATLRAALGAMGEPVDRMEVIFTQFVTLKRGGEKVKMSKRAGDVEMLRDLVTEVGPDAARFFFLMRTLNSPLEFDLDLATTRSQENPVYYLQYAHARLCSLMENARAKGVTVDSPGGADPADLAEPETRMVLRKIARFPLVVEKAALTRAPHLLTHELLELAQAVHQFYTRYRVVGADTEAQGRARLVLCGAARRTIANGLELLGVSAPEQM